MEHAVVRLGAIFAVFGRGALSVRPDPLLVGAAHGNKLPFEIGLLRDSAVLGQVLGVVLAIFGLVDEREPAEPVADAPMHLRIDDPLRALVRTHQLLGRKYTGSDGTHVGPNAVKNPP